MKKDKFHLTKKVILEARAEFNAEMSDRAEKLALKFDSPTRSEYAKLSDIKTNALTALRNRGLNSKNIIETAKLIGENYHRNVGALYTSKYAAVAYGNGGDERIEWLYAKSYKHPARWHDAGARWEIADRRLVLIVANARGNDIAKIPMPRSLRNIGTDGCIHGDAYSIEKREDDRSVWYRFDASGQATGVSVLLPAVDGKGSIFEHGADLSACLIEHARKIELHKINESAKRETEREKRRLRLLARISKRISVTRTDASLAGACKAGIDGWCERMGISESVSSMTAHDVFRLALKSNERMAMAAAIMAARRAIARNDHANA